MNVKKMNKEELKMITRSSEPEEQKENDLLLYNLYRKAFTEYIVKILNLKSYDNQIRKSELKFKEIDVKKMDIYQYILSDELKFLYIRNNIYIEALSQEEIQFLRNRIKQGNEEFDQELEQFIKDTYKKVIFEDLRKDGKRYLTFYGPESDNFIARNDSIVIGMRYDEFDLNGLDDQTWDEIHRKQLEYLQEMFYNIAVEQRENVSVPITVLKYNQFSVKVRGTEHRERIEKEER